MTSERDVYAKEWTEVTENREVYDADGNPKKKATSLKFKGKTSPWRSITCQQKLLEQRLF
jgi:hypothetical protein